jgi:hypothetical protein
MWAPRCHILDFTSLILLYLGPCPDEQHSCLRPAGWDLLGRRCLHLITILLLHLADVWKSATTDKGAAGVNVVVDSTTTTDRGPAGPGTTAATTTTTTTTDRNAAGASTTITTSTPCIMVAASNTAEVLLVARNTSPSATHVALLATPRTRRYLPLDRVKLALQIAVRLSSYFWVNYCG